MKGLKLKVAAGEERDVHRGQEKVDNSTENCYDCRQDALQNKNQGASIAAGMERLHFCTAITYFTRWLRMTACSSSGRGWLTFKHSLPAGWWRRADTEEEAHGAVAQTGLHIERG